MPTPINVGLMMIITHQTTIKQIPPYLPCVESLTECCLVHSKSNNYNINEVIDLHNRLTRADAMLKCNGN